MKLLIAFIMCYSLLGIPLYTYTAKEPWYTFIYQCRKKEKKQLKKEIIIKASQLTQINQKIQTCDACRNRWKMGTLSLLTAIGFGIFMGYIKIPTSHSL